MDLWVPIYYGPHFQQVVEATCWWLRPKHAGKLSFDSSGNVCTKSFAIPQGPTLLPAQNTDLFSLLVSKLYAAPGFGQTSNNDDKIFEPGRAIKDLIQTITQLVCAQYVGL